MKKRDKDFSIALLGSVAVIGVLGLVLLFSNSQTTAELVGDKTYGGALKNVEFPYWDDRTFGGIKSTPEGTPVSDESTASFWGYPKRTFPRDPLTQIATVQTACGEGFFAATFDNKNSLEAQFPDLTCSGVVEKIEVYCCPIPYLLAR